VAKVSLSTKKLQALTTELGVGVQGLIESFTSAHPEVKVGDFVVIWTAINTWLGNAYVEALKHG
jgi:hypothetical protein